MGGVGSFHLGRVGYRDVASFTPAGTIVWLVDAQKLFLLARSPAFFLAPSPVATAAVVGGDGGAHMYCIILFASLFDCVYFAAFLKNGC